jgi:cyclopropane-fatty-acyl-phospholipid synthase
VRHPDALAHLVRDPGELGLARAWVSGALDVDGDIEEAFALLRDRVDGGRLGPREWAELAATAARLGALRLPPIRGS